MHKSVYYQYNVMMDAVNDIMKTATSGLELRDAYIKATTIFEFTIAVTDEDADNEYYIERFSQTIQKFSAALIRLSTKEKESKND